MTLPPSRSGLRSRLLALVLAPALIVAVLGGATALREQRTAATFAEVRDEVRVLSQLTELRRELLAARAPIEIEQRAGTLGIERADALALLDVGSLGDGDLAAVRRVLGRLPDQARPFTGADLEELQAMRDAGKDLEVIDGFDRLDGLARLRWEVRLDRLRERVVASGSLDLSRRLDDLEAATEAGSAGGTMLTKLAAYWFGTLVDDPRAPAARADLIVGAKAYERSIQRLQRSADPEVAANAERIAAAKPGSAFELAVNDAVQGRDPQPFDDGVDVGDVADTFTSGLDLFAPLLGVMEQRGLTLEATADQRSEEAARASMLAFGGMAAVILLMVGVSIVVASSIERPLTRLIDGTRRVGGGDLTVEPLPVDGPSEIGEATEAFNDVVANLRLVKAKIDALADSDLDDPRLGTPLPGDLGEAMDRSVDVLSRSLADRDELQERLAYQATHDDLTSLPNRPGALEALDAAIARSRRSGTALAVACLDLDGFKQVNDTYGHQTGDDVLVEVARRLDAQARAGDFCARLGGDEFVVIAEQVDGIAGAVTMGQRIADAIGRPMEIDQTILQVGASVGIAVQHECDDTPLEVLAKADAAAYRAKHRRSQVEVWDPSFPAAPGA